MTSARRAALVAMLIPVLPGCASYHQEPNLALAQRPAPQGLPVIGTSTSTLKLGPKGMEVPVKITWTRVKDDDCSRVGVVDVARTGGPDGVQIEAQITPGMGDGQCMTQFEGPPERFDDVLVFFSWKARRGISTFDSRSHGVTLHGDGRSDVTDNIIE